MPDPNPSNRERLLRLIDGGADALKELQREEAPETAPASPAGRHILSGWKIKIPVLSAKDGMRLAKWLIALVAVVAMLHYALEMMKTMKGPAKAASAAGSPAAAEDKSGIGLKLVGVDTSDALPVALLEDLTTGKTYFARVNEKVKDARVKQIQKNKVTLSFQGRNVELR